MPKLIEMLKQNKMTLIVTLPQNSLELALAAKEGGADALMVNIAKEQIEGFEQEKKKLKAIIAQTKLPVGVSAGWEKLLDYGEVDQIIKLGFDFMSMGLEHLSPALLGKKKISKFLSLNSRYSLDDIVEISKGKFDALEAAVIPTASWGKDLVVYDLQNYISIVISAGLPVIIPTQLSIRPSETAIICDIGAKGLLLTPVVTGTSVKHIKQNTQEFRVAIDELGE
ncbi:MAG: hypothetical protein HQ596_06165 [Candidatus Saganbacteria bacterium]|nr:hypothetical protein [Candidatus Saganbacteria bacterium]